MVFQVDMENIVNWQAPCYGTGCFIAAQRIPLFCAGNLTDLTEMPVSTRTLISYSFEKI